MDRNELKEVLQLMELCNQKLSRLAATEYQTMDDTSLRSWCNYELLRRGPGMIAQYINDVQQAYELEVK